MTNNINNSSRWHIFYCSLIGLLLYLNYSNIGNESQYTDSVETNKFMTSMSEQLSNENQKQLEYARLVIENRGDTALIPQIKSSIDFVTHKKAFYEYIKTIREQLWAHCGGRFSDEVPQKMLRYKYYFPRKNFFDEAKINEISSKMKYFDNCRSKILGDSINPEENGRIGYCPIWTDTTFWERLQHDSPTHALRKLGELMLDAQNDEKKVLHYHYIGKTEDYEHCYSCFDPQLRIVSNQINVANQDYFEGDIKMISTAFLCQIREFTCLINGKKIPYKDKHAYVNVNAQKLGQHTLDVEIRIKNPVTGDTETLRRKMRL